MFRGPSGVGVEDAVNYLLLLFTEPCVTLKKMVCKDYDGLGNSRKSTMHIE